MHLAQKALLDNGKPLQSTHCGMQPVLAVAPPESPLAFALCWSTGGEMSHVCLSGGVLPLQGRRNGSALCARCPGLLGSVP